MTRPDPRVLHIADIPEAMRPVLIGSILISLAYAFPGRELDWLLPGALAVTSLWTVFRMVQVPSAILTPMPWFLLTYALFFGFGMAVYPFMPLEVKDHIDGLFPLNDYWIRRTNVLNAVSLMVVCVVFYFAMAGPVGETRTNRVRSLNDFVAKKMMWACIVLGYGARVMIRAGDPTGVGTGGVIKNVENLTLVAIALLGYLIAQGHKKYVFIVVPALVIETWLAFSMLMKNNVMFVGLFLFLGVFWARPSRRLLLVSIGAGLGFFLVLSPVVELGRALRWNRGDLVSNRDLILSSWRAKEELASLTSRPKVYAWTRMIYANAEAFAMNQYDRGLPGDTYKLIPVLFVPRAIWPNKPITTPGVTFNELALGSSTSASSPGAFGEAYWNGGWTYVVLSAIYVALLFAAFTRVTLHRLQAADARWLPAAALMVTVAVRPDTWLVSSFIGVLPVLIVFMVVPVLAMSLPRQQGMDSISIGPAKA